MLIPHTRATAAVAAVTLALVVPLTLPSAASASPGQSVEDLTTVTPETLAATLAGPGVSVSNVSFQGSRLSSGTFSGFDSIGIASGVALTTGSLDNQSGYTSAILGPNTSALTTTDNFQPGDADLDALAGGATQDAAVLEFDFVPTERKIQFRYIFGSEEYPEWVGQYNDLMGFWINGTNCATVSTPAGPAIVSVNTINASVNAHLYRDNSDLAAPPYDTQLDGLTTVLTCTAEVTPNVANHLKVAIADDGDGYRDSAVLLEAGTQLANSAPVAADATATAVEGTSVDLQLSATDADGDPLTYAIASQPANGSVTVAGDIATYTPAPGFSGTDTFTYTANDGFVDSQPATVTVTVTPAAPIVAPVAGAHSVNTGHGTAVVIPVLDNATGDDLTVASVGSTLDGTVVINAEGTLTFTPKAGFAGTTSFEYTIQDARGATATGVVTVTVAAAAGIVEEPAAAQTPATQTPAQVAAASAPEAVLAATGSDSTAGALAALAALLAAVGALILGLRRQRRA